MINQLTKNKISDETMLCEQINFRIVYSDEKRTQPLTAVWQNGGAVINSKTVLRLSFYVKLNICDSISATSPSCKPLAFNTKTKQK